MTTASAPPLSPSAAGERVYHELLKVYGDDAEVKQLARCAADAWSRLEEARAQLAVEGLVVRVGKSTYGHPSLKVEVAARAGYLSAMRILRQPTQRSKPGQKAMGERLDPAGPARQSKIAERFFGAGRARNGRSST